MGPGRAVVIVETLPHSQLLIEIHVIAIREQLVVLVLVSSVRAFDLAVELRRAWLDVDVLQTQVSDVPVKERLELVAAIGSDCAYPKRELLHRVVDEVDGGGLRVAAVGLQRTNACGIVNRVVSVAPYRHPLLSLQRQESHVYLHLMPRNLLFVAVRVYRAPSHTARQSIQAMSLTGRVDGRVGCLDGVVPLQAPDDAYRRHVDCPA